MIAWININDTKNIGVVAATITAVLVAAGGVWRIIRSFVRRVAKWIQNEVRQIVQGELQPVKSDIAFIKENQIKNKETNRQSHSTNVATLNEIKDIVSELLPNGGSRLRDTINTMDHNIKKLIDPEEK